MRTRDRVLTSVSDGTRFLGFVFSTPLDPKEERLFLGTQTPWVEGLKKRRDCHGEPSKIDGV